jgi:hypothetical protein
MLSRVVWSSVAAALFSVGAVLAALLTEESSLVIALGAAAITAAILATRER